MKSIRRDPLYAPPSEGQGHKADSSTAVTTYILVLGLVLAGSIMLVGDVTGFGVKTHGKASALNPKSINPKP
jgi:hypothetical protein